MNGSPASTTIVQFVASVLGIVAAMGVAPPFPLVAKEESCRTSDSDRAKAGTAPHSQTSDSLEGQKGNRRVGPEF